MRDRQTGLIKRIPHIDLLESLAIFFVILYHSNNFAKLYTIDIIQDSSVLTYIQYFSRTILSTCVPLFFFAHGYLLFKKDFNLKKHIHRTIRLIVLILIWAIILMPLYMLIAGDPISVKAVIHNILNLDVPYFWFLEALLCLYIFFPALKALFDSNKKAFIAFIIAAFILTFGFVIGNQLLSITGKLIHHPLGNLEYPFLTYFNILHNNFGYSFVYFCVGGLAFAYEDKIRSIAAKKRNIISIIGLLISCLLLFVVGVTITKSNGEIWDVVWNGYDTIFTFCNVIFIYTLSLNYTHDNSFIRTISSNTLGIYLTHALLVRTTGGWVGKVNAFCNFPSCVLYALIILCVCLLGCCIIRKLPVIKNLL